MPGTFTGPANITAGQIKQIQAEQRREWGEKIEALTHLVDEVVDEC